MRHSVPFARLIIMDNAHTATEQKNACTVTAPGNGFLLFPTVRTRVFCPDQSNLPALIVKAPVNVSIVKTVVNAGHAVVPVKSQKNGVFSVTENFPPLRKRNRRHPVIIGTRSHLTGDHFSCDITF
jgi:hypothetical protein